jgi:precorrin-6Y C5,15-methyltransferase (decarboxylating)
VTAPWLAVIGIGEDGLDGLNPAARALLEAADVIAGGERHLAMLGDQAADARPDLRPWPTPLEDLFDELAAAGAAGRRVVVLATGNPMWYGVGVKLSQRFQAAEMIVLPSASAFDLACARMAWAQAETHCLTVHGRPIGMINGHLTSAARLVVLCRDGKSPREIAAELVRAGFGQSSMTALSQLGGPDEARLDGLAESWSDAPTHDFVTVAIACAAGPDARVLTRAPGLPDDAFRHDGQLTKREVRAVTLSALGPHPGGTLWDIGAGCGSIAIEWMRQSRHASAIAIESDAGRAALISENAATLGAPLLKLVIGRAPEALDGLDRPDAVFIGGGLSNDGVFEAAWRALKTGGRLVANTVTTEGEARLLALHPELGGELRRIAISRAEPKGRFTNWRSLAPVTQWSVVKSK